MLWRSSWPAGVPGLRGRSARRRTSPRPEVCEIIAPPGKMRGPGITSRSIASSRPKAAPPTSRTVVKPRSRQASASCPATRWMKPTSAVSAVTMSTPTRVACQWQSISPGITARPPQERRSASAGPWPRGSRAATRPSSTRMSRPSRIARVSPSNSRRSVSSSGRRGARAAPSRGARPKPANIARIAPAPPRIRRRERSASIRRIARSVSGAPQRQGSMGAARRRRIGRQARHIVGVPVVERDAGAAPRAAASGAARPRATGRREHNPRSSRPPMPLPRMDAYQNTYKKSTNVKPLFSKYQLDLTKHIPYRSPISLSQE